MKKLTLILIFISILTPILFLNSQENENFQISYIEFSAITGATSYKQLNNKGESFNHTISSFMVGKYEVIYELWYVVYQWAINNGYTFENSGREGNDGRVGSKPTTSKYEPVTNVNWRDAIVWCNAYSEMDGYDPVYYTTDGKLLKDSSDSNADNCDGAKANWSANGYRLPTEGEWIYAASESGETPWDYASGAKANWKDFSATDKVAWYEKNSGGKTHNVGTKKSNYFDIFDLSGNVQEWCWDWYGKWPNTLAINYRGPSNGSYRIKSGGSWNSPAEFLIVGDRNSTNPYDEDNSIGFRLVRIP